jgi:hypothetical protein
MYKKYIKINAFMYCRIHLQYNLKITRFMSNDSNNRSPAETQNIDSQVVDEALQSSPINNNAPSEVQSLIPDSPQFNEATSENNATNFSDEENEIPPEELPLRRGSPQKNVYDSSEENISDTNSPAQSEATNPNLHVDTVEKEEFRPMFGPPNKYVSEGGESGDSASMEPWSRSSIVSVASSEKALPDLMGGSQINPNQEELTLGNSDNDLYDASCEYESDTTDSKMNLSKNQSDLKNSIKINSDSQNDKTLPENLVQTKNSNENLISDSKIIGTKDKQEETTSKRKRTEDKDENVISKTEPVEKRFKQDSSDITGDTEMPGLFDDGD